MKTHILVLPLVERICRMAERRLHFFLLIKFLNSTWQLLSEVSNIFRIGWIAPRTLAWLSASLIDEAANIFGLCRHASRAWAWLSALGFDLRGCTAQAETNYLAHGVACSIPRSIWHDAEKLSCCFEGAGWPSRASC